MFSLLTILSMTTGRAWAIDPSVSPVTGIIGSIFWHETGHALTAKAGGFEVISFQPYPSMCGANFRPGCVIVGGRTSKGILPFLSTKSAGTLISVMGTGFSIIGVLATAPLLPRIDNEHNRKMFETMIDLQTIEWPMYVLSDLIGYGGDWSHIAKNTKIPLIAYLPFSIAAYVGLSQYSKPYKQKAMEKYEPEAFKDRRQQALKNPTFTLAHWRLRW